MNFRLPWRITQALSAISSSWYFFANCVANLAAKRELEGLNVLFCVPFYGYTGGAYAVISTANLLSGSFNVSFLTKQTNVMNKYVSSRVRMVTDMTDRYDICLLEAGIDRQRVAELKKKGTRIIHVMHGAPPTEDGKRNHGYTDEQVDGMILLADSVQYISDVQLPFFDNFPTVHRRKVPNFVLRVDKRRHGNAAGIVCDTTLVHKKAKQSIRASQLSRASTIEVWGRNSGEQSDQRIHWHGFSRDKEQIYNSFDVLVHLSELENQPLVILEALSAGIPCVLAPLPTYQFLRDLNGVFFADADDPVSTSEAINKALACPSEIRQGLQKFWYDNHSPPAILAQWRKYFSDVSSL